jgi:hypothetical protein
MSIPGIWWLGDNSISNSIGRNQILIYVLGPSRARGQLRYQEPLSRIEGLPSRPRPRRQILRRRPAWKIGDFMSSFAMPFLMTVNFSVITPAISMAPQNARARGQLRYQEPLPRIEGLPSRPRPRCQILRRRPALVVYDMSYWDGSSTLIGDLVLHLIGGIARMSILGMFGLRDLSTLESWGVLHRPKSWLNGIVERGS